MGIGNDLLHALKAELFGALNAAILNYAAGAGAPIALKSATQDLVTTATSSANDALSKFETKIEGGLFTKIGRGVDKLFHLHP